MTAKKPKYRRHSTGKAFVEWKGKRTYFPGSYDSPESRAAYDQFLRERFYSQRPAVSIPHRASGVVFVAELLDAFIDHAETYYGASDPSSEYWHIRRICGHTVELCGAIPVTDFGPLWLKEVRSTLGGPARSRPYINKQIQRLVRGFKWGVENELVPYETYAALTTVQGLRRGRCDAREPSPVQSVSWDQVEVALKHASPILGAMIRLQWWTGCRPQNVCYLRPTELDRSSSPWKWEPTIHKNVWRGQQLIIFVGPNGQEVLTDFLDRPAAAFCFDPREAAIWHAEKRSGNGDGQISRRLRDHYDTRTYRQAIIYCLAREAGLEGRVKPTVTKLRERGVDPWSPHQIRHARGNAIRQQYGIEAAQSTLGHESLSATEIYTSKRLALAKRVALETG